MATVTYRTLFYPGPIYDTTLTDKVENRDTPTELPLGCFGYQFFERTERKVDGELLVGPNRNQGPMVLIGTIESIEDIPNTPENRSLLESMRANKCNRIVRTIAEVVKPLLEGMIVYDKLGGEEQK